MRPSPEIVEAVPESMQREYDRRMKLTYITAGCMAINTGAFFVGFFTRSPYIGDLAVLWELSLVGGLASTTLNYLRKQGLIEKMSSLDVKTTFTAEYVVKPDQTKGKNRLLRLMPPSLRSVDPSQLFRKDKNID